MLTTLNLRFGRSTNFPFFWPTEFDDRFQLRGTCVSKQGWQVQKSVIIVIDAFHSHFIKDTITIIFKEFFFECTVVIRTH